MMNRSGILGAARRDPLRSLRRAVTAFIVAAAAYETVARSGIFPAALFPTIPTCLDTLVGMIADGSILWHAAYTLYRVLVGFGLAYVVMVGVLWIVRNMAPTKTQRRFRLAQTASAAAMALGHGLQDAQKTMGVIVLALVAGGFHSGTDIPLWVKLCAASAISLGTYSGGWRIMRTLGRKIIELDPARGFVAETAAATVLYTTAFVFQAPISTTHTITSAIMGVGATKRLSAVRWGVARNIGVAWILTIPMAALVAAAVYTLIRVVGLI